jgi:hypothetical protein
MANKYLTLAGLKAATNKTSKSGFSQTIISFDPLEKALKVYEQIEENNFKERRDALDGVMKAAADMKKSKFAKDDKDVLKYLDDVLKAAAAEQRKIEADLVKYGMQKVKKLSVFLLGWKEQGEPMENRQVQIVFDCPSKPEVMFKGRVSRGALHFTNVDLPPDGALYIKAFQSQGADDEAAGRLTSYNISKKQHVRFLAKQAFKEDKYKAATAKEAIKKSGVTGKAGVSFTIKGVGFDLGSEVNIREKEDKDSKSDEKEYQITVPRGRLDIEMK